MAEEASSSGRESPTSGRTAGGSRPDCKWSFLFYLAGDNDLSANALSDLDEMSEVGPPDHVHVAAEVDTSRALGSIRYEILSDWSGTGCRAVMERLVEQDSGDPLTLRNFIDWGRRRCNTRQRMLVVWGHGLGKHVAVDDNGGGTIDMPDLRDAIRQAGVGASDGGNWAGATMQKLAILGFDACLMAAIENVNYLRKECDYIIASQQVVPADGWPYGDILRSIKATPDGDIAPGKVARNIVDAYIDTYERRRRHNVVLSAIDVSRVAEVMEQTNRLGALLADRLAAPKSKDRTASLMKTVRNYAQGFFLIDFVDLGDIARLICGELGNEHPLDKGVSYGKDVIGSMFDPPPEAADRELFDAAFALFRAIVAPESESSTAVYSRHGKGGQVGKATGLSIWFPAQRRLYLSHRSAYRRLFEETEHGWLAFLDAYHAPVSGRD